MDQPTRLILGDKNGSNNNSIISVLTPMTHEHSLTSFKFYPSQIVSIKAIGPATLHISGYFIDVFDDYIEEEEISEGNLIDFPPPESILENNK